MKIYFFIIFFFIFKKKVKESIELLINYIEFNHQFINICIGTTKQCLPFKIIFNSNFSYVIDYNIFEIGLKKKNLNLIIRLVQLFNQKIKNIILKVM